MTGRDEDPARLADEALDRLIHLHSGNATDEDRREWRLWQTQGAAHAEAAREAEDLWTGLGVAGGAWARGRRSGRLTRRALLLGGATALGGAALHELGAIGPHLLADHRTGIAERRDIRLDDGTRVTLDARSALSDRTLDNPRQAELLRGRILIEGGSLPGALTLHAGRVKVHTTGTSLDIDRQEAGVTVTTLDGGADVSIDGIRHRMPEQSRLRIGAQGLQGGILPVDVAAETAWRRGKLIFDGRELSDLVTEIERYRGGRILIADEALARLQVTGIFDLSDPDGMLDSMALSLPLRISKVPMLAIIRSA